LLGRRNFKIGFGQQRGENMKVWLVLAAVGAFAMVGATSGVAQEGQRILQSFSNGGGRGGPEGPNVFLPALPNSYNAEGYTGDGSGYSGGYRGRKPRSIGRPLHQDGK
jgi:hypothetical protein